MKKKKGFIGKIFVLFVLLYVVNDIISDDRTEEEIDQHLYNLSDEGFFLRDLERAVLYSLNVKRYKQNLNKLYPIKELYGISLNEARNKFNTDKSIKEQCYEIGLDTMDNCISSISYTYQMNYDLLYKYEYPKTIGKLFINNVPEKTLEGLLGDQDIASCGCVIKNKLIYCTITAAKKDFRTFARLF